MWMAIQSSNGTELYFTHSVPVTRDDGKQQVPFSSGSPR
jgi:hypothetical protein